MSERNEGVVVGARVICNGHVGVVREVCEGQLKGLAVVRLERGQVCVDVSELKAA